MADPSDEFHGHARTFDRDGCLVGFEVLTNSPGALDVAPKRGRSLALVHGFGTSRRTMRTLARSLLGKGRHHRALLIDLRGHGETRADDRDDAHSYAAMAGDLLALLHRECPDGAELVGHSMGGQISLLAAIEEPDLVHSLTTIGAGPCRAITAERERKSWERAAAFFEQAEPPALAAALADAAPANVAAHPELEPSRLYADARGVDLARIIRGGFFHVTTNDDACRALETPTLVVVGSRDEGWRTESEKLAALIPNSRLELIPEAGHWAHIERQPRCTKAITAFLT